MRSITLGRTVVNRTLLLTLQRCFELQRGGHEVMRLQNIGQLTHDAKMLARIVKVSGRVTKYEKTLTYHNIQDISLFTMQFDGPQLLTSFSLRYSLAFAPIQKPDW